MKQLLLLCTKNVHFTCNDGIYTQNDGVAMGSPLGPVLAGVYMVELETKLIPSMIEYMLPWKRYVDDTITAVREDSVEKAVAVLNGFNKKIQFTYELEDNHQLTFLDVRLIRREHNIDTAVYRKPTHNAIYLHWESFTRRSWRLGTLKALLIRAHKICSNTQYRDEEIQHIREAFTTVNGYPDWTVTQALSKIEEGIHHSDQQDEQR